LWLGAEDNIQVVYPTTPAQYFHCLRRQALRAWKKPLVIMTPKSLLRLPQAVSALDAFAHGTFQRILPDQFGARPEDIRRVILCAGKVFYELEAYRQENKRGDVAILRLEQLYPLRHEALADALAPYRNDTPALWVQEEPANMGAWNYLRIHFGNKLLGRLPFSCVARGVSATPATGSHKRHKQEQADIVQYAFD
jgi:2-oxoglutarate dehydrogenase E1 component